MTNYKRQLKVIDKLIYLTSIVFLLSSCTASKVALTDDIGSNEVIEIERLETLEMLETSVEINENLQTKLVRNYQLQDRALPYPHPTFYPIVSPYQKMRNDSKGDGFFGASRGRRTHNGLDIIVTSGSAVYSPIEGVVFRKAYPYGTTRGNAQWEGFVILGVGDYRGYEVKIFYTRPFVMGDYVFPGDIVGVAQDISRKYSPAMIDHVHIEVRRNGQLIDPAKLFKLIE